MDSYLDYYHRSRTHLSLARNAPVPREIEPPHRGKVIAIPQIGVPKDQLTRENLNAHLVEAFGTERPNLASAIATMAQRLLS